MVVRESVVFIEFAKFAKFAKNADRYSTVAVRPGIEMNGNFRSLELAITRALQPVLVLAFTQAQRMLGVVN